MFVINLLWYFVIFSFLGWLFNGIGRLISEHKFVNKGFLTLPFFPTYGFCAVICYLALNPFLSNKIILFVGSAIILSLLSVLIGTFTEKVIGCKPWDYTSLRFNIGSYITIPYAVILGVAGLLLIAVVIPVLDILIGLMPSVVSMIIVLSICFVMLVDYAFSLVTTYRLKKRMKKLNNLSAVLGDDVPSEKIEELQRNYNALYTEGILRRRLVSAFPELKTSAYVKQVTDKLDEIKNENMKEYTTVYEKSEEKPFAFGFCFAKLFYLFVIGSFLGTVFETVWALFAEGHFEMRVGMVYGPFIPVYGGGACLLTAVLYKLYKLSDTVIFVISAFVGAFFEYICSWAQEMIFGTVSWDYSGTLLNLDGRTNLMFALIWGFLGLVWVRYIYPFASKLIEKIPVKVGTILTMVLLVFMLVDGFMTTTAVYRWNQRINGVEASNRFEEYLDYEFNDEKMRFLFPHMQDKDEVDKINEQKGIATPDNAVYAPADDFEIQINNK